MVLTCNSFLYKRIAVEIFKYQMVLICNVFLYKKIAVEILEYQMVLTCNGFIAQKKFYKYQKPDVRLLAVEKEIRQNEENSRQVSNFISNSFIFISYIYFAKKNTNIQGNYFFLDIACQTILMMTMMMTACRHIPTMTKPHHGGEIQS